MTAEAGAAPQQTLLCPHSTGLGPSFSEADGTSNSRKGRKLQGERRGNRRNSIQNTKIIITEDLEWASYPTK